jgi:predicted nucleotide-binding protein
MSAVATLRAENADLREQRDEARRSRNNARLELAFFMGALSKRRAQRLYRKARAALSEVDA